MGALGGGYKYGSCREDSSGMRTVVLAGGLVVVRTLVTHSLLMVVMFPALKLTSSALSHGLLR